MLSTVAIIILVVASILVTIGLAVGIHKDLTLDPMEYEDTEDISMFKVMKYGAEGKEVAEVQKLLQAAGSSIKVNGKFTIGMLTAVKCFQKKNGLAVTGQVDSKTMTKLKTYVKPAKKTAPKKAAK